jgi:hypothetical protein
MAAIKIAFTNVSTVLKDDDFRTALPALQTEVSRDVAPVWGLDADLSFVPKGTAPPALAWQMVMLDDSDYADDLGYHETTKEGLPMGKVFIKTIQADKCNWTITASHELLEMLADPYINRYVFSQSDKIISFYSHEFCDPCEDDGYGYSINGTMVSDFVYPAWFEGSLIANGTQSDQQNKITAAFQLLASCSIQIFDVSYNSGWYQQYPPSAPAPVQARPAPGSRQERRLLPRALWRKSGEPSSKPS